MSRGSKASGGGCRELFGEEDELLYCANDVRSQQNRCLVSGRLPPRHRVASYADDDEAPSGTQPTRLDHAAFLELLEAQFVKYEASLPMDLRVRGLVSAKFGYDGTKLPWDAAMEQVS